ncbi:FAD-dependent monooxygenase [Paenarthrobacter aurescens]|nr:FAD-dependent monooxygenase [Paenarthrobacter aurescens]
MTAETVPDEVEVMVVGAGPTGLTAAIELAGRGISVCVIDSLAAPRTESRALAVWPRTRDVLTSLQVLDDVQQDSDLFLDQVAYELGDARSVSIKLPTDTMAQILPQPVLEQALIERLGDLAVSVHWGTRLVDVVQHPDGVSVTMSSPGQNEHEACVKFIIGADGASSSVRSLLGISYVGHTIPASFHLADCTLQGFPNDNVFRNFVSQAGYVAICPLPDGGHRIFARSEHTDSRTEMSPAEMLKRAGLSSVGVRSTEWTSDFRIHERVSETFRQGNVFLAGDAAHTHSPAGGQGIQTGIGDAHNLSWKLSTVLRGIALPSLLDSYETERRPVAQAVIDRSSVQAKLWDTSTPWKRRRNSFAFRAANQLGVVRARLIPALLGYADAYPPSPAQSSRSKQFLHQRHRSPAFKTNLQLVAEGSWSPEEIAEIGRLQARHELLGDNVMQISDPVPRTRRGIVCVRPDGYAAFRVGDLVNLERGLDQIIRSWANPRLLRG